MKFKTGKEQVKQNYTLSLRTFLTFLSYVLWESMLPYQSYILYRSSNWGLNDTLILNIHTYM